MAKEKQLHLLTALDIEQIHHEGLPIWAEAVAVMATDRINVSELKIKSGETLKDKYPLLYESFVNTISAHIIAVDKKVR